MRELFFLAYVDVVSLSPILGLSWFWPIFESYLRGLFESLSRHLIVLFEELEKGPS